MKKIIVIGMGKSGQAAYAFLSARGDLVLGVDDNPETVQKLLAAGLNVSASASLGEFDTVVVSPGISPAHPLYAAALAKGMRVIGEAELVLSQINQPCVAITGTNGKTTVTLLVTHVLNASGKKARALGNVGEALGSYFLEADPQEVLVVEMGSYQLETMESKVFDAGVILNITPDHLDRYPSMEAYAKAKCRLQKCMKSKAFYVNTNLLEDFGDLLEGDFQTYGSRSDSYFWTDKKVVKKEGVLEFSLPSEYEKLGMYESENVLAAWVLCRELGITPSLFLKALDSFKKPSHRLEFVSKIDGVCYYDDSKGTNIDATIQAVGSMSGGVILIAGGVDKGSSYAPWKGCFAGKVKRILAIGQAAKKISDELQKEFPVMIVSTLSEAVELASSEAKSGESVLLSPGCASFDMFRDYAHRGEEFKRYVHDLEERRKKE